jgi:hypothetical protein
LRNPLPANGATRTAVAGGATVNWGDLSLRIPTTTLGAGRSLEATVSLAQPAPAGGRLVTLASTNVNVATVSPPNVTVPEGASVATFSISGVAAGAVTLIASSPGLQSTTAPLTVNTNLIILGNGVVLTAGQGPQPLPVSLSGPATSFATIVLTSSNPAVATVTQAVSIPTGQQGPVSATLSAVSPGVVTITATGAGLGPDVTTVFVVGAAANRTWTGAVSTDWANAGNWSSSIVPLAGDNVAIPGSAINQPTISSSVSVRSLDVATGAVLTVANGATLTAVGTVTVQGLIDGGPVILGGNGVVSGNFGGDVEVTGIYTAFGTVTLGEGLDVFGTLHIDSANVACDDLATRGDGVLGMQNPAGMLTVSDADFHGGVSILTAGTLQVSNNFEQLTLATPRSYDAAATHTLVLNGGSGQDVFVQSTQSRIGRLVIQKTGSSTIRLASNINVLGQLVSAAASTSVFVGTGGERMIFANGGIDADGVVFDNVRLGLAASAPAIVRFDNATFQNMQPTSTQLTVQSAGTFTFRGVRFLTTPTSPGLYVTASTVGTPALVVNMSNSQPANGSAFTTTLNGATVNWIP